jgi:hypothetical protein
MKKTKHIDIAVEIHKRLQERRLAYYEPLSAVINRLLDATEPKKAAKP